jgi:hypothetical protein
MAAPVGPGQGGLDQFLEHLPGLRAFRRQHAKAELLELPGQFGRGRRDQAVARRQEEAALAIDLDLLEDVVGEAAAAADVIDVVDERRHVEPGGELLDGDLAAVPWQRVAARVGVVGRRDGPDQGVDRLTRPQAHAGAEEREEVELVARQQMVPAGQEQAHG